MDLCRNRSLADRPQETLPTKSPCRRSVTPNEAHPACHPAGTGRLAHPESPHPRSLGQRLAANGFLVSQGVGSEPVPWNPHAHSEMDPTTLASRPARNQASLRSTSRIRRHQEPSGRYTVDLNTVDLNTADLKTADLISKSAWHYPGSFVRVGRRMMTGIGLYPIDQVCWATLSALPAVSEALPLTLRWQVVLCRQIELLGRCDRL